MNPRPVTGDCEHRASSTYLDIDPQHWSANVWGDFLSTESFDQNETTNFKSIQVSCLHQKVNNINNKTFNHRRLTPAWSRSRYFYIQAESALVFSLCSWRSGLTGQWPPSARCPPTSLRTPHGQEQGFCAMQGGKAVLDNGGHHGVNHHRCNIHQMWVLIILSHIRARTNCNKSMESEL